MQLTNEQLGEILVKQNYLSEEERKRVLTQATERNVELRQILYEEGLLTPTLLENALAEHFGVPFIDLSGAAPGPEEIGLLPEDFARSYTVIALKKEGDAVTVASADPKAEHLEELIRLNIGKKKMIELRDEKSKKKSRWSGNKEKAAETFTGVIKIVYAPKAAIEAMFGTYRKPLATRFQSIIENQKQVAPEILEEIFADAITLRASDIHFEPQEIDVIVRFRVDGVMHEAGRIPRQFYEGIVNRIKIESNMRIDEHYAAQDGAIRYKSKTGNTMDVRVSVVPLVDGEKVVMRLLSEYVRTLTLGDLGFSAKHRDILLQAAHKPFGMILTTGPTGSGKSTTLYGLLKIRNRPDVNISTIEDPVEYKIPGINHIQANEKTGLTFAKGLRALVRQDPDIILVGEIRDNETASIAVNAALTGHLLFSTLHANDAATAIPRLIEMGVEPFLIASTLEVVVAQRLARRICPSCRFSYVVSADEARSMFPGASQYFKGEEQVHLYRGKGCDVCGDTGYKSRIGVYELLIVNQDIEDMIIHRKTSAEIIAKAREQGMTLLFEDGLEKVMSGMTTIEELMRIAAPPEVIAIERRVSDDGPPSDTPVTES